jgi:coproporphyrinogen III oxidase
VLFSMMSRAQRDAAATYGFSGLCAGQSALVHWRTQPTGTIHIGAGTIAALIAAAAAAQWLDGPVDLAPSLKLPV